MDLSSEISKGPDFEKTENEKNGQQNKEKGHCIPSFISKAYEILEVQIDLFRKMNILILFFGVRLVTTFTLKISNSLKKKSSLFILDIKTLLLL